MVWDVSKKIKIGSGIAAAVLLLAGVLYFVPSPQIPLEKPGLAAATLVFDFGDGRREEFAFLDFEEGESLFDFTRRSLAPKNIALEYQNYSGLGALVTRIGDKENGEDGKYWQYWVNGEYAQIGASFYIVRPGDVIEWKFAGQ